MKPSTQKQWRSYHQLLIEQFGHVKMNKLDRQMIQIFFTQLSKRISAASVQRWWVCLSGLLKYAVEEGIIDGFDKPKLPKIYKGTQQWLTLNQMRNLIEKSDGWVRAMIMLLSETGCRIGEALGLQTADLDTETKTLSINRTMFDGRPNSPKTQSSYRSIAISDELCYALDSFRNRAKQDEYIFRSQLNNPRKAGEIIKKFNAFYDKLGMQHVGFHAYRRGNITHLVMNLEIQE
jgi:integrase